MSQSLEQRKEMIAKAAEQRYVEFLGGETKWVNYLPLQLSENAHPIVREFHDFTALPGASHSPGADVGTDAKPPHHE